MRRQRWQKKALWSTGLLLLVAVALSGCGQGGARHESWPNLIIHEGVVYAANLETIVALEAETGYLLWSYPPEDTDDMGPFYTEPVLVESSELYPNGLLIVAGFKDQRVYGLALNAESSRPPQAEPAWTFAGAGGQYVGNGTLVDATYIIGNGDGKVYALSVEDGTAQWSLETDDRVWARPVAIGDTVYIASLDHKLYAVDLHSGELEWERELEGAIAATPVVVNEALWVGDFTQQLYKINPTNGEILWQEDFGAWLWATPLVDDTRLYLTNVSGEVYAFDTESETMIWDQPVLIGEGEAISARPALSAKGNLLFVAAYERGEIYAIDTEGNSMMRWGAILSNPGRLPGDLTTDDERLYTMPILIEDRIRAFDLEDGSLLWNYPPTE
ncbi:MAG: PQQ-binding-like beta-propeller repeat protein [Anaerolineales bacterium]